MDIPKPFENLFNKDTEWAWDALHQEAFGKVKDSLLQKPVLDLPDSDRPISVVCDASVFAIGSALLQADAEGHDRMIAFEFRQLKAAAMDYPLHDKELLAIKSKLVKFGVHVLGFRPYVIYTDHASLRTATQPHPSQRMARWLSFFAKYNFEGKYKPGEQNAFAAALSRRPDNKLAQLSRLS